MRHSALLGVRTFRRKFTLDIATMSVGFSPSRKVSMRLTRKTQKSFTSATGLRRNSSVSMASSAGNLESVGKSRREGIVDI